MDDLPEDAGTLPAPTEQSQSEELALPSTARMICEETTVDSNHADAPDIPGYSINRLLGKGTYGEVWLYTEDRSGREVAIKFLARRTTLEWTLLQAEVMQLARMDDIRGIVQLKAVESDAEPPYYVMTYAEGGSLAQRLKSGPLPLTDALTIFEEVTRALAYVHAKGVRHCDLKPGNVLLDALGKPLLADFGQALLEGESTKALGTLFYMAPEQATLEADLPDARWDVYGLGALLYTMLVGNPPRCLSSRRAEISEIKDQEERLRRYRESLHEMPRSQAHRQIQGIDPALVSIIDRCLDLEPEQRFPDAGSVHRALEERERSLGLRPFRMLGLLVPMILLIAIAWLGNWVLSAADQSSKGISRAQVNAEIWWRAKLAFAILTVLTLTSWLWLFRLLRRCPFPINRS